MIFVDDVKKTVSFTLAKGDSAWDVVTILAANGYWVRINELEDKFEITIKEDLK